MSDLEKLLEKIDKITAPFRLVNDQLNQVIPPYIQKINQVLAPVAAGVQELLRNNIGFFEELSSAVTKIAAAGKRWQEARKADVALMAENGWYPNWFTFFYSPEAEPISLDELMIMHLNDNWSEITQKIIELCPNRALILENAFTLHRSGNYVAAIPLFLSQADGICCESLKSFLFTGNETEEKIQQLIEGGQIEANMFTDIFLEPFSDWKRNIKYP